MSKFVRVSLAVILIAVVLLPSMAMAAPPVDTAPNNVGKKPADLSGRDYADLVRAGHNPNNAYLKRDYTAQDPTTRVYTLETGEEALIAGGLPQVTADGKRIDTEWSLNIGSWMGLGADYYESGNNYFTAHVRGTEVKVWSGDDRLFWDPILYIGGVEASPLSGPLIVDDPVNENYEGNTMVWNYGVCLRYVRLIEGMIQEWWKFSSDPGGEVRIDHRSSGNLELPLGYAWDDKGPIEASVEYLDDEVVSAEEMREADYPVFVAADLSFYSDVCGYMTEWDTSNEGDTWATLRNGDGESGADHCGLGIPNGPMYAWQTFPSANEYHYLTRSIYKFDTSSLNDGITVTAGTFSLYGYFKDMPLGDAPATQIYQTTTAFDDDIIWSDFDGITTTALSASSITYANWVSNAYNVFTLNATGLGEVSLTGRTQIGVRDVTYDVANNPPTWANGYYGSTMGVYLTPQGSGFEPRLTVTYTTAAPAITAEDASSVAGTTARLNSVVVDDGGEACEVRFGYGTTSQTAANFALYDTATSWVSSYVLDDHPFVDVSGLPLSTTHYYRVQIKNTDSTVTSTNEIVFTTTGVPDAPTDVFFLEDPTIISFSWTRGAGSTSTVVRFALDDYPTVITGGSMAANTTDPDFRHTDRAMGTRYYYSFFGVTGGNSSATYATAMVTTSVSAPDATPFLQDISLEGAFEDPDPSGLPGVILTALYAGADAMNMDRDTFSMGAGVAFVVIMGAGGVAFIGGAGGIILAISCAIVLAVLSVIPGWLVVLTIIAAIGFGGLSTLAMGRGSS